MVSSTSRPSATTSRVTQRDKAEVAELAIQWDYDYWDGSRETGYGGYKYDGRWRKVADAMVQPTASSRGCVILDVGSGKGFLLHDFTEACPGVEVAGIDVSTYGVEHTMESVKPSLPGRSPPPACRGRIRHFDLVISITTLHNLYNYELWAAFKKSSASPRRQIHLSVRSYRNEREKVNLMYWQLTCAEPSLTPKEWQFVSIKPATPATTS